MIRQVRDGLPKKLLVGVLGCVIAFATLPATSLANEISLTGDDVVENSVMPDGDEGLQGDKLSVVGDEVQNTEFDSIALGQVNLETTADHADVTQSESTTEISLVGDAGDGSLYDDEANIVVQDDAEQDDADSLEETGESDGAVCIITFDANGGKGTMDPFEANKGESFELPKNGFTRSGYVFSSWNTKADGSGTKVPNAAKVKLNSSVTLYAQWVSNSCVITYNANGGKGKMAVQKVVINKSTTLKKNKFTRVGYAFVGWNTKANGTGTAFSDKAKVTIGTNTKLYAQWEIITTNMPSVRVSTQKSGWRKTVRSGAVAGTTGKSDALQSMRLELGRIGFCGGIEYRSHIQGVGWEDCWANDGRTSGTSKKSRRIEAVQIRLYGEAGRRYDVYYRVHVQGLGWMAWAKNGARAGTQGKSLRMEALQVILVKKGSGIPAKTFCGAKQTYSKAFVKK